MKLDSTAEVNCLIQFSICTGNINDITKLTHKNTEHLMNVVYLHMYLEKENIATRHYDHCQHTTMDHKIL